MASTYTDAGIELIGIGEQSNTWGQTTNTNWRLAEELVVGVVNISLNGLTAYSLTTVDGVTSNGRHMVVRFTGDPGSASTVTVVPDDMEKVYLIHNDTTQPVTITQGSGNSVTIPSNSKKIVYCDGDGASASVQDMYTGDFSGTFDGNFDGAFDGTFDGTADFTSLSLDGTEITISATQINESITAAGTSYDNTSSGITASTVQAAIDEVQSELDGLDFSADVISYDNAASGLDATNVQDAVDETFDRADTFIADDERVKTATNSTGSQPIYAVRAWANVDAASTPPAIRASGNVSSVTRLSAGRHQINFTTAFDNTNYSVAASKDTLDTSNARVLSIHQYETGSVRTTVTNDQGTSFTINSNIISIQVVK